MVCWLVEVNTIKPLNIEQKHDFKELSNESETENASLLNLGLDVCHYLYFVHKFLVSLRFEILSKLLYPSFVDKLEITSPSESI